jgi:hypothetical protein
MHGMSASIILDQPAVQSAKAVIYGLLCTPLALLNTQ